MKPKEKAEELFDKMSTNNGDEYHHCTKYVAIQCALIAVDELIYETFGNGTGRYKYWTEVKQEIEKL